jgi:chemotaxis signal transduction protein
MIYFLAFDIDDIMFAVPIDEVSEVARPKMIVKKEKLTRHFAGFIDLRKEHVPVFNLNAFFGMKESDKFEVIISRVDDMNIGIMVDKVSGIISAEELFDYPGLVGHARYLKGVITQEKNVVQVVSLMKIMSGQRLKNLKRCL